jgi:hypothetical protein
MELEAIVPHPVIVMVDALHWILADTSLAQRSRVDVMVDARLLAHNEVVLLDPTGTATNTARMSYVTRADVTDTLRQTAMSLQLPSLSRNINGTYQTT